MNPGAIYPRVDATALKITSSFLLVIGLATFAFQITIGVVYVGNLPELNERRLVDSYVSKVVSAQFLMQTAVWGLVAAYKFTRIELVASVILAGCSFLSSAATLVTSVMEVVGINTLIDDFGGCTEAGVRQCRLLFQWRSLEAVLISAYVTAPLLCLGHVIIVALGLRYPTYSERTADSLALDTGATDDDDDAEPKEKTPGGP